MASDVFQQYDESRSFGGKYRLVQLQVRVREAHSVKPLEVGGKRGDSVSVSVSETVTHTDTHRHTQTHTQTHTPNHTPHRCAYATGLSFSPPLRLLMRPSALSAATDLVPCADAVRWG